MSKPQHEMRKAVSYWITSKGWSWARRAATYMRQANCEVLMNASTRLDELEIKNADLEAERGFLLSALGRVQEMTKDSHPVAYGIAEHAIDCTRRVGDSEV